MKRPVLVDSLEGTVHLAYGALPNMSFIIGRGGRMVYKADWTDDRTIRHALEQMDRDRDERRAGSHLTPYYVELLPQRPNSMEEFMQGLLDVPGPRAAKEFLDAIAARSGENAVRQMREFVQSKSGV